ncbi:MAG: hypothetical protein WCW52_00680 [Elusimicrobiales bacterium]|jgi:hypothetical protein
MKLTNYAVLLLLLSLCPGRAAGQFDFPPPSPEMNPYTDPAFQDFVETVYGYRNPDNAPKFVNDFRDALTSLPSLTFKSPWPPSAERPQDAAEKTRAAGRAGNAAGPAPDQPVPASPAKAPGQYYKVTFAYENGPLSAYVAPLDPNALAGFKAGDYVFITVLPTTEDYPSVIRSLSDAGFKFAGEKTYFTGGGKTTVLLGWAPYSQLVDIYRHPRVRRVSIEKKASGVPFRTRIRFTLRAPGGALSGVFVSDFVRRLCADKGFASENVFRLPQNAGNAKFTAFEVTGSLPVDMVGEIVRSPFVAAVEFKDKSM